MSNKYKLLVPLVGLLTAIVLAVYFFRHHTVAVLSTHGPIAHQERNLIIFASLLSLIVVIPVFVMTILIVWRYREGSNRKAKYSPDWDHDARLEATWWLVPGLLIVLLSVVTWRSSHQLDPSRPLDSSTKPLTVQVVALQWKWLFIYPEQNIATVNYLAIPTNRPINFMITADAPMNSFWIPQLSGQIYAMSGMSTQLHLMADDSGEYLGRSANISGAGFAKMQFQVKAESPYDFNQWISLVKSSSYHLDSDSYRQLAIPTENQPIAYYSSSQTELYDMIVHGMTPEAGPMMETGHHD